MRCYVIATGIVFALISIAHVARVVAEGTSVLANPMLVVMSLLSLGFAIWAFVLIRQPR